MGHLAFVTGGARSGKSRFAERWAADRGAPVVYLATMEAGDDELAARIARHQAARSPEWRTVEEPRDPAGALATIDPEATVLLDCLSLWVTNELLARAPGKEPAAADLDRAIEAILAGAEGVLAGQRARPGALVAVTNEVGSGIVPVGAITRAFRDALGLVNQAFAAAADEAHLLVSGIPVRLR